MVQSVVKTLVCVQRHQFDQKRNHFMRTTPLQHRVRISDLVFVHSIVTYVACMTDPKCVRVTVHAQSAAFIVHLLIELVGYAIDLIRCH